MKARNLFGLDEHPETQDFELSSSYSRRAVLKKIFYRSDLTHLYHGMQEHQKLNEATKNKKKRAFQQMIGPAHHEQLNQENDDLCWITSGLQLERTQCSA